jgi:hypothetical protein
MTVWIVKLEGFEESIIVDIYASEESAERAAKELCQLNEDPEGYIVERYEVLP